MATSNENLLLMADAYKYSHPDFYPEWLEFMYSYLESRGGKFTETTFEGLDYIISTYLQGKVLTKEKIEQAVRVRWQM